MEALLFQIYAPLVSWGEIAVGGERQSSRHPSKSAITGLVAAALGIKREEEEKLNDLTLALGMGIKMYSSGTIMKDYHTTQVPKSEKKVVYHTRRLELNAPPNKIGTILSQREYRADALYLVAIYLKNDMYSLSKIASALRKPVFHLYFGRKSCVPSLPLAPKIITSNNLKALFANYRITFPLPINEKSELEWLHNIFANYPKKTLYDENVTYFWEDGIVSGMKELHTTERYDQPLSRKRWQFQTRTEYAAVFKRKEEEE